MFKKAGIILFFIILFFILVGQFLNNEFDVEQSIEINSHTEIIHYYVNDLKQWPKWTPWKAKNPDVRIRYGNVTQGVGASQSWHAKRSNGHLNITVSSPDNGIAYDVYFRDDRTPSISAIEYNPIDSSLTRVSWRIHGEVNVPIIGGYITLLVKHFTSDMYQKGLQKLKTVVEADKRNLKLRNNDR